MGTERFKMKFRQQRGVITGLATITLVLVAGAASATTLGTVAGNITGTFSNIGKLITATSYIAGLGFAVGAIMKFKAHKDNPAQEPIGKPIGLLMVAAALLYLPTLLDVTKATTLGATAKTATSSGTSIN